MSIHHRKLSDWLRYKPAIFTETMILDENFVSEFQFLTLQKLIASKLEGDDRFTLEDFQQLAEYCIALEEDTTGIHCAFDMVSELITLLKDGVPLADITALPPTDYLTRMGWNAPHG